MKPIEENTAPKEDFDKKLSPSQAVEELNSWRGTVISRMKTALNSVEQEQIEKEAIEGIKAILGNTEKCNLLPEGWEKQGWETLSMTIAKLHIENEKSVFYLV